MSVEYSKFKMMLKIIHTVSLLSRELFYIALVTIVPLVSHAAEPKVSAGHGHNMALSADGIIYTWGRNDSGQLGNGSLQDSTYPIRVPGMDGSSDIAAGGYHSIAKRYNRIWVWGDNSNGQLGNESSVNGLYPERLGIETYSGHKIGAGYAHSLIERKYTSMAGGVFSSFGSNNQGELGIGIFGATNSPRAVCRIYGSDSCSKGLILTAEKLDGGQSLSAVLTDNNDVYTWGINYDGSLGTGNTTPNYTLTPVESIVSDVVDIAVGEKYILAAKLNGTVWSWGNNRNYYYLGRNDYTRTPGPVPGLANVKQVATGDSCSAALKQDGTVWAWGSDYSFNEGQQIKIPLSNIEQLSGNGSFLAMESDGIVWQWNCGDTPTQVPGENGVGVLRLIDSADVSVIMSDINDPVRPGDPVQLSVLVTNEGPQNASEVIVTISLPSDVSYSSTIADEWICNETSLEVTCTLPLLESYASRIIDVTYNTPAGSQERNSSVVISTESLDPISTNDSDQESTVANSPPSISGTPSTSVDEDEQYTFSPIIANTDLGETLTFTISAKPPWASFDSSTGTLSGIPGNEHVGNYTAIIIAVSDSLETASLPPFDITVSNVNDPPTIDGTPSPIAIEDSPYEFSPTYVDIDEGDSLTFSVTGLPSWASFNPTTGTISGTPGNGDVGVTSTVGITVGDGDSDSAPLTFDVTVENTNDAPTIDGNPPITASEGAMYSFLPTSSDKDTSDVLTFSVLNKPSWIDFDKTSGQLTGTPENGDVGMYRDIAISVSDGTELATLMPFDLTVVNVNDSPTISGVPSRVAMEDSLYSFTPESNDPDAGDELFFSISGQPTWAEFDVTTGRIFGTPDNDDVNSSSSVVISVSDGIVSASLAEFDIEVLNINDAPDISGVPRSANLEDTFYSFTPEAIDIDTDDTLIFSITNKPSWASFNSNTGELSGTPTNADVGVFREIVVSVTDGTTFRALPAFTITVANQNDPPVISGVPPISASEDSLFEFLPTAFDDDEDSVLVFSIEGMPDWASFDSTTGRLSGTPGNEDPGMYTDIVIVVTDGNTNVALPPFDVFVNNVNDAPTISGSPSPSAQEDVLYSFTPSVVDVDPNDSLIFSIVGLPSWATFNASTGNLEGTPDDSAVDQLNEIVISVTDGAEIKSLAPFQLKVTSVNDSPSGEVLVEGEAMEDKTLFASNNLIDVDGIGVISFQWFRENTAINGATSERYLLTQSDVGSSIRVVATYIDGQGTEEVISSVETGPVLNVNDNPVISGQPLSSVVEGEQYLFVPSVLDEDPEDILVFSIEGQPDWANFDTSTGTLSGVPDSEAAGMSYRIYISVDDGLVSVSLPVFSLRVTNINDVPIGDVIISGVPRENEILTLDQTIKDADGIGELRYQWLRTGIPIDNATTKSYLLNDVDVGQTMTAMVTYIDGHGNEERVTSLSTYTISNINDLPRGFLEIVGFAHEGNILSFSETLEDEDGMGNIDFHWLRNGSPVQSSTGTQYVLTNDDVGAFIQVRARYLDDHGSFEQVLSEPSAAVGNINDSPTGEVEIIGLSLEGQILTASSNLFDPDGIEQITWQWLRNGGLIAGATENTYILSNADVDSFINVRASYTDGHGTVERVDSLPMERVANINEAPVIEGTPALIATPGIAYVFSPDYSDNDLQDTHSFSVEGLPNWAELNAKTGTISGTPGSSNAGSQSEITLSISDGEIIVSLPTFTLTVLGTSPVISAASPIESIEPIEPIKSIEQIEQIEQIEPEENLPTVNQEEITPDAQEASQEVTIAASDSEDSGGGAVSPLTLIFLIISIWIVRLGTLRSGIPFVKRFDSYFSA